MITPQLFPAVFSVLKPPASLSSLMSTCGWGQQHVRIRYAHDLEPTSGGPDFKQRQATLMTSSSLGVNFGFVLPSAGGLVFPSSEDMP